MYNTSTVRIYYLHGRYIYCINVTTWSYTVLAIKNFFLMYLNFGILHACRTYVIGKYVYAVRTEVNAEINSP